MGSSGKQLTVQSLTAEGVLPARSPGPLGHKDAADPNALACMPGDTPGPVGYGGDAGAQLCSYSPLYCEMTVPVISVDLSKMRRMLHTVAYAEAADQEATRDFGSSDISLGNQARIEQKAALRTDELMHELQGAMEIGPARLQEFIDDQEACKDRARSSLQKKLGEAAGIGKRWEFVFGTSIKVLPFP